MNTPKAPLQELSLKAILLGIILAVVLAGANAYLGLYASMTVSASIPAAVISMGILSLFKRSNILENNIVQTAASAGESLAAGVIFTLPALILMGYWDHFDYFEIAKISAIGGIIGVMFTVPLRRALIVEAKLLYPEGIATAEVLKIGEEARTMKTADSLAGIKLISLAGLMGGLLKLGQRGFAMWGKSVEGAFAAGNSVFGMGMDLSPALLSVGFIVGRNIAILVFSGGLISWLFAIPIYTAIYGFEGEALDAAWEIWDTKIRYLGVGAMVVGGIWSLIKLAGPLKQGIKLSLESVRQRYGDDNPIRREDRDFPIQIVGIVLVVLLIPVFLIYLDVIESVPIAILLSLVMMVFGFFFSAVASYMAGVVGSSNNPISGVTIATILFSSLLLLLLVGAGSMAGAAGAILIGAVVCCAAAIGGDNLQDLKTGYILGATPWKQQVMQLVGVLAASMVLGLVLDVLHTAYTIGSPELAAPQATLMKSVAEGVFQGNLPWNMVLIGAVLGVGIILLDLRQEARGSDFRIPLLAVAVGIYLPIELSVPIFIGGMISEVTGRMGATERSKRSGVLLASGLITGEAIMGILVAVPIYITKNRDWWPTFSGYAWLGPILVAMVIAWFFLVATPKNNEKKA